MKNAIRKYIFYYIMSIIVLRNIIWINNLLKHWNWTRKLKYVSLNPPIGCGNVYIQLTMDECVFSWQPAPCGFTPSVTAVQTSWNSFVSRCQGDTPKNRAEKAQDADLAAYLENRQHYQMIQREDQETAVWSCAFCEWDTDEDAALLFVTAIRPTWRVYRLSAKSDLSAHLIVTLAATELTAKLTRCRLFWFWAACQ